MTMTVLYIANIRFPTEKAHGLHIVKMCQALARSGADVKLVVPKRKNVIFGDVFEYYGVEKKFDIEYLPVVDCVGAGFFGYWVTQLSFILSLLRRKYNKIEDMILTRDEWSGWVLAAVGFRVFYDMHGFPVKWMCLWKRSMQRMRGIICTNGWKIEQCHNIFGIDYKKMVLARNGFDPKLFCVNISKEEARERVGLPLDKNIVLYSGHLYDWKGVDTLARAASFCGQGAIFVFLGGSVREINEFAKRVDLCDNILVLGQKSHREIPLYLKAADVLVLPSSRRSSNPRFIDYSLFDTSPIKLFEYMASRRPIVASDLPSLREVLNEKNAIFAESDNPEDLAQAIEKVLKDRESGEELSEQAHRDVQQYTWDNRAKIVLDFINDILNR